MRQIQFLLRFLAISALLFPSTAVEKWGTFRPQSLISARAPVPHSPYFGFAYHPANSLNIRHVAAEHQDKIQSFSWSRHDADNFGDQHIRDQDANLLITTSFVAHPSKSACVIRISAEPLDPNRPLLVTSIILYAVTAPEDALTDADISRDTGSVYFTDSPPSSPEDHVRINGTSDAVGGDFTIRIKPPTLGSVTDDMFETTSENQHSSGFYGTGSRSRLRLRSQRKASLPDEIGFFQVASDTTDNQQSWNIEKLIEKKLTRSSGLPGRLSNIRLLDSVAFKEAPVAFVQRLVQAPFQLEATLVVTDGLSSNVVHQVENELSSERLDERLISLRSAFDQKFERLFGLQKRGFSEEVVLAGKESISNILGGIGFFYGSSIVEQGGDSTESARVLRPVSLLTATPSRVVFPRGFLWDEGFHQEIIRRWDAELSLRCVQSWLSAVQSTGWIPREQILGLEARNRFPAHVRHLMIQIPSVANPPTILMPLPAIWAFMKDNKSEGSGKEKWLETSVELLKSIERYYEWLKESQAGLLKNSFRWRGRLSKNKAPDGYPLTLSSGLDDYPRALSVSNEERHVDLHSWLTWASRLLARIHESAGQDASHFWADYEQLKDALTEHHTTSSPHSDDREDWLFCDYDGAERICHEGYVTILPLVLGLLDVNDKRVSTILDALEDPDILRGKAGVRSLSKMDRWYRRGDDYWTGSVWMPFNYLTLAALKMKYGAENGPYQERALNIYKSLRNEIIENTLMVHAETGQLWENYSPDDDGLGKSGRQFTGWTSLILLILAEMFDGVL